MSIGIDRKFAKNSAWSFLAVAANVAVAIFLSPYILRNLGAERYGIWALVFTLLDYMWFFDFGFMSAVANLCARYLATGQRDRINQVINTATFYFGLVACFIWISTPLVYLKICGLFQIPPEHRHEFSRLVLMTGLAWGICAVMQVYLAALDGFQRFDLSGRVSMFVVIGRSSAYVLLLKSGFGLVALGWAFIAFQICGYALHFWNFRRCFPELRIAPGLVNIGVLKEIASYGIGSFVASTSSLCLNQSAPMLIGHFLAPQFVSYYTLPVRLMQNAVDVISRIGIVTRSRVAELDVSRVSSNIVDLAIFINRYCFALFMPLCLILCAYGRPLISLWLGPAFGAQCGPLLPWVLAANLFAVAGQFNSGSVLFGLGKHRRYAALLFTEGVVTVVGLYLVIPRAGILGAAILTSVTMILSRGLVAPYLVCEGLNYNFFSYLRKIYLRPLAAAIPAILMIAIFDRLGIHGTSWGQLLGVAAAIGVLYCVSAFLTCIAPAHRTAILTEIRVLRVLPGVARS